MNFHCFCFLGRKKDFRQKIIKPEKGRATDKYLLVESTELSVSKSSTLGARQNVDYEQSQTRHGLIFF